MKDENDKTVWIDFGGNAFAVPKKAVEIFSIGG